MSKYFCKMIISRLAVVGIAAFLGITCFAHKDVDAGKKLGQGVPYMA